MMNSVIEAINKRRSIRAYEPTPIPKDVINTIIKAGNQAPSTMGMVKGALRFQPWRFVVVEDLVQTKTLGDRVSDLEKVHGKHERDGP